MKKIAVSRLHLSSGEVKHNQVLVFEEGRIVKYYPLTCEEPCTTWLGGDYYLSDFIGQGNGKEA